MRQFRGCLIYFLSCFLVLLIINNQVNASINGNQMPGQPDLASLSLEELMDVSVYSASRFRQNVKEAPSSVTVITSGEIKKYGYRTLADILRSARGIFTTNDRNYNYIGVRGFARPADYNSRVLLLVDGHRINDNIYDQASIGTDFVVDIDLISSVEIIRGPSSSIYGANAFFGVINVITKNGRDFKSAEVSGEAGSLNTYKGRLSYGNNPTEYPEFLVSASAYDSNGNKRLFFREFDNPENNNGIADNKDKDYFKSVFAKTSFRDFTLEGAYTKRTKYIPTASFGTVFNGPDNRTVDESAFLDLKYERNYTDRFGVMARVSYGLYNYHGFYDYMSGNSLLLNKDASHGDWWGADVQFTTMPLPNHRVIFGSEYQANPHQDQRNSDISVNLDDRRHSANWALYVQDEYTIIKDLILNAGLRYDHYETFGGTTNPRLALIYNPADKTTLKLLYGRAFRAANAYELYYNDLGLGTFASIKPNPSLKPETIKTYELILEQHLGKYLRGTASGYYYKINDLINQTKDTDGLLVYKNIDKVEARGMELELEGKLPEGISGKISYAYQKTKDLDSGDMLTNSPRHMAKAGIIVPALREKVFIGLEEQYMSARKTLGGDHTRAVYLTNLTLFSRNLMKAMELSFSAYNLFDKKYGDPGAEEHLQDIIEQDGRTFRFKLTYLF